MFVRILAVLVFGLSAIVLLGWSLRIETLTALVPGFVSMKANTAVALAALSFSLFWLDERISQEKRWLLRAGVVTSALAMVVGLLTFAQYVFGVDLGIDQLLFLEFPKAFRTSAPGRMAPQTAICLALTGAGLLALRASHSALQRLGSYLWIASLTIVIFTLIGFCYRTEILFYRVNVTQIAPHTAIALLLLNIGALAVAPEVGPLSDFFSTQPGGYMARRLVAAVFFIIPLLGWLALSGIRAQLYATEVGIAAVVLGSLIIFMPLILQTARRQNLIQASSARVQSRAKNDLARAKEIAESANQAKTQFLANMSHEIRTPLAVVIGMTELVLDQTTSPEEKENLLQAIHRNSRQLSRLVDQVLDLSKIEADALETERLRFSLHELIQHVSDSMGFKATSKGLKLTIHSEGAVPRFVQSDPTRLHQILDNLLTNAIKFTERGGVTVTIRELTPPTHERAGQLEFLVADTGIGLSPEQRERLFQPFTQADLSTTRRFGGSGLGLVLSRRLARALGGEVKIVRSELGEGTTFSLVIENGPDGVGEYAEISAQEFQADRCEQNEPKKLPPLNGLKVLLIDDSDDNRKFVTTFLKHAGAEVLEARGGSEGIERALGEFADVVLMDIQMPEVDGYQATAQLRASGFAKPIIALTAHALQSDRERALSSGFNDYLTKPINSTALIATVGRYRPT